MFDRVKAAAAARAVIGFLGAVPGAVRDHINVAEAVRIGVAAALAGGGVYGVLFAELARLPEIVTPADAATAAAVVTLISETLRRLGHGVPLPPNFPPAPPQAQALRRAG